MMNDYVKVNSVLGGQRSDVRIRLPFLLRKSRRLTAGC